MGVGDTTILDVKKLIKIKYLVLCTLVICDFSVYE